VTEVRVSPEWDRAIKALRGADKVIRKELNEAIRAATKPIVQDMQSEITSWDSTATRTGGGAAQRARVHVNRSRNRASATRTAARRLSKGGFGLRRVIAASIQTKISYSGSRQGVRIRVDSARLGNAARNLPKNIDEGKWRHPVYGNRDVWVTQTGKPGWFTATAQRHGPAVHQQIQDAMNRALERIGHGI
jgi:hypothetical protein